MSKKLPACAVCGKKLTPPRIIEDFVGCPGGPRIGWHRDCAGKEASVKHTSDWAASRKWGEMSLMVIEIFRRGANRVTCACGEASRRRFEAAMDEALNGPGEGQ